MAEISKIELPNGAKYDLKDETARTQALEDLAHWMAIYAVNLSDIESEVTTQSEQNTEAVALVQQMERSLEEYDIKVLNTPNLLPYQPQGVSVDVPSGPVITKTITVPVEDATAAAQTLTYTVTDEAITAAMVLHGIVSSDYSVVQNHENQITGTASAGSMTVTIAARPAHSAAVTVTLYICAVTSATLPYGESARYYATNFPWLDSSTNGKYRGDEGEEISERLVTLTGDDIINDSDGATYSQAVAFTVTNPPAQGKNNSDVACFNYGNHGEGEVSENLRDYGSLEMEVGHTYTMSCWARITSGTKGKVEFVYCPGSFRGERVYHEITNTEWQRLQWTFIFNPSGAQYNDCAATKQVTVTDPNTGETTTQTVNITKRQAMWTKTVGFGVCRAYAGTVQLCGFRLTQGNLWKNNAYEEMLDEMVDVKARIAQLEADVTQLKADVAELKAANDEHIDLNPIETDP